MRLELLRTLCRVGIIFFTTFTRYGTDSPSGAGFISMYTNLADLKHLLALLALCLFLTYMIIICVVTARAESLPELVDIL